MTARALCNPVGRGIFPQFETTGPACQHPPSNTYPAPQLVLSASYSCQYLPLTIRGLTKREAAGCSPTWPAQEGEGETAPLFLMVKSLNFFIHPLARALLLRYRVCRQRRDPCEGQRVSAPVCCLRTGASLGGALLMLGRVSGL